MKCYAVLKLFFYTCSIFFINLLAAQNNVITPSPDVANIGQANATPMNLYTGRPAISFPIYTINVSGYNLPIALNYNVGGVKVADVASSSGLGWNLQAGGQLARNIVGIDDDKLNGYISWLNCSFQDTFFNNLNPITPPIYMWGSMWEQYMKVATGECDGQPDDYFFSIPEGGGKLLVKDWSDIKTVPESNQRIYRSGRNSWGLEDGNGRLYEFNEPEEVITTITQASVYTYTPFGNSSSAIRKDTSVNAWQLTRITLPNNEKIEFFYDTVILHYDLPRSETMTMYESGSGPSYLTGYTHIYQKQYATTKRLKKIKFSTGEVVFEKKTNQRVDMTGDFALGKILIKNERGDTIKQFRFDYDYMIIDSVFGLTQNIIKDYDSITGTSSDNFYPFYLSSSSDYPRAFYKRMFLKKVTELNKENIPLNGGTEFEYHRNIGLPLRDNYVSTDWWGYNNGNTTPYSGNIDYYYKVPYYDYTVQGSLKKIKLPTGGSTEYKYMSNYGKMPDAYGQFSGYAIEGTLGGLAVTEIKTTDSVNTNGSYSLYYSYEDGTAGTLATYSYPLKAFDVNYRVVSSNPTLPLNTTQGSYVGYGKVTEGGSGENGKNEYYYTNHFDYPDQVYGYKYWPWGTGYDPEFYMPPNTPVNNNDWKRGVLKRKKTFQYDPVLGDILRSDELIYPAFISNPGFVLNSVQASVLDIQDEYNPTNYYGFTFYTQTTGHVRPVNSFSTQYDEKGNRSERQQRIYTVDKTNYLPRFITKEFLSHDSLGLNTKYDHQSTYNEIVTYLSSFEATYTNLSKFSNRPVEKVKYSPDFNPEYPGGYLGGEYYDYDQNGNVVRLYTLRIDSSFSDYISSNGIGVNQGYESGDFIKGYDQRNRDERYVLSQQYKYLPGSQLLYEKENAKGEKENYLWGYSTGNNKFLVAKIVGGNYDSITKYTNQSFLDSALYYSDEVVRIKLDQLRQQIPEAAITSYTYFPLVGVTSETDPNGNISYYVYDEFNRLRLIRDVDNNIIKKMDYSFAGVPYSDTLYENDALSQVFSRSDCATSSLTGGDITYTVQKGRYVSVISKAAANARAQNELTQYGQVLANMKGSCAVYYNEAVSKLFYRNNCSSTESPFGGVTYQVEKNTHTSTISQADANQKAYQTLLTDGQTYANSSSVTFCAPFSGKLVFVNIKKGTGYSDVTADIAIRFYKSELELEPLTSLPVGRTISSSLTITYTDETSVSKPFTVTTDGKNPVKVLSNEYISGYDPVANKYIKSVNMTGGFGLP